MSNWYEVTYRKCKSCGDKNYTSFAGARDFFNVDHCKKCGEKGVYVETYIGRNYTTGSWLKPWTWKEHHEKKRFRSTDEKSEYYDSQLKRDFI